MLAAQRDILLTSNNFSLIDSPTAPHMLLQQLQQGVIFMFSLAG